MIVVLLSLLASPQAEGAAPPVVDPVEATSDAPAPAPASDAPAPAPANNAPAPEPAPAPVATPTTTTATPTTTPPANAPTIEACLALVRAGKRDEAKRCYALRGDPAVADLVGSLRLPEPELPPPPTFLGTMFSSGKAELIATSTLLGGYVGVLGATTMLSLTPNGQTSTTSGALLLLAPVVGGGAGLGVSMAILVYVPSITAGDANVVRAFELLGAFDSAMFAVDHALVTPFNDPGTVAFTSFSMAAIAVAGTGAGAALAAVTDLPESAGSLAVSGGLWTTVVVVLAADMSSAFKVHPEQSAWWITAAGNAGFAAALFASPYLPVTRAETWALDVGGGVGLAAGASLAFSTHAPNPFLGWGTILVCTGAGMAAGYSAAHFLPGALEGLPELVAVAPLAVPGARRDAPTVVGLGAVARF